MIPVPLDHAHQTFWTICFFTHSSALIILAIAQNFWSTLFVSIALLISFYAEDFHVSLVSDVCPSLEFIDIGIDLDRDGDADMDMDSYPTGLLNACIPLATNFTSCLPCSTYCNVLQSPLFLPQVQPLQCSTLIYPLLHSISELVCTAR